MARAAGTVRRVAMRPPYHLGVKRVGSSDRVIEVVDLEPQCETVAARVR
jgi:hypothetical protein